jgi:hypothetical protein
METAQLLKILLSWAVIQCLNNLLSLNTDPKVISMNMPVVADHAASSPGMIITAQYSWMTDYNNRRM